MFGFELDAEKIDGIAIGPLEMFFEEAEVKGKLDK